MVVMVTVKYRCVPSFTSMHCMVCKCEVKCLRSFFVNDHHENAEIHMHKKFHLQALRVCKFEK